MKDKAKISWEIEDVSLLSNGFIKRDVIKIMCVGLILLLLIFGASYLIKLKNFMIEVTLLTTIYVMIMLIIIINCNNKYTFTYILGEKCANFIAVRPKAKQSIILRAIRKIPLPYSKLNFLDFSMNWKGVRSILIYQYKNTIVLKNKSGEKLIVFCKENVFDSVNSYIQEKCPKVYPMLKL